MSTRAALGGSTAIGVDRHQGWARRPDVLRVHTYMRVRPTESGEGQATTETKFASGSGTNSSIAAAVSLPVASCGPGPSQLGALRRSRVLVRPVPPRPRMIAQHSSVPAPRVA